MLGNGLELALTLTSFCAGVAFGEASASVLLKKFLRWQFAEVCEAANTDLSNVFQICSSNAFGLASLPVSLKPSRPRPLPGSAKRIRGLR
jgi:hypothetical protein